MVGKGIKCPIAAGDRDYSVEQDDGIAMPDIFRFNFA
jgi:hypothetical protein